MIKCRIISTFVLIGSLYFSGCASQPNKADSTLPPSYKPRADASVAKQARRPEKAETQNKLPELNDSATLQDYLTYAALNNPGLEAAFNRFKAALEEVPQAMALPDPKFNYQYFIQEVETRVGPQRQSYGIAQMFPWFGKLDLKGDIAAQAANAARQRYEAAKLKLFFEVKDAYYEYYYLEKSIAVTKENVNLLNHLESVAQRRYETGAAAHPDVIRAQVELGKVDDRYRTLIDLRRPIVARLNAALNRPIDADIPGPAKIELLQTSVSDEELLGRLIDSNPELKAIEHEIARGKHAVELAKKNYYPDFTLGVNYIDTDDALTGDPKDDGKDPVVAMLSINLPLWREKYDAAVRQARARYQAARRDKTQKANDLSLQLKLTLFHFRDAERKLGLYGNALLPKAQESLKVTESQFRAGRGTFTDLIDAQRILLEFALARERALADRAQNLAKLEMLTGWQIPDEGNN